MRRNNLSLITKRIGIKFAFTAALVTVLILVVFSYFEINANLHDKENELNTKIQTLTIMTSEAFSGPLWNYDENVIGTIAEGLFKDGDIASIRVLDNYGKEFYSKSNKGFEYSNSYIINKTVPIERYQARIGQLKIDFTNYYLKQEIKTVIVKKVFLILFIAISLIVIMTLISIVITKPIKVLSRGTDEIAAGNLHKQIYVKSKDEIGELASKFNIMTKNLSNMMHERNIGEEALKEMNEKLEIKVEERTQDLIAANQELRVINEELFRTLDALQKAQSYLVESEKMAALGTLVAGIAHEINTPIGISITAVSFLKDSDEKFSELFYKGNAKRSDLEKYLLKTNETATMIFNNLDRAAKLIRSFKQVAVDQSNEERRTFRVKQYLEELIHSLYPNLKKTKLKVTIGCEEECEIDSYPGAIAQIITNLIMNSIIHAYGYDEEGEIRIDVIRTEEKLTIEYSDDGKGMEIEVKDKIFEPFFTTKRGEGGTGLGLHVIYNIVTLQLKGQIVCSSAPGKGTAFLISLPL
jgi:signal transduction histidine kinase